MEQGSDILETNPTIQMRFEELEEWCELLECRLEKLEIQNRTDS